MVTIERLMHFLTLYEDGCFYNNKSRGRAKIGERAGFMDVHGYWRICIDGVKYYEHHLVWLWVHGEWPGEIDHRDGDQSNNKPDNLRECTRSQNNFNSLRPTGESGLRGAYLDRRNTRWYSKIQLGGQVRFLGCFDTAEEAHEAFMHAVEHHHGEFAYHNRNSSQESM